MPRKNKAVILLSTFHHEKNIDEDTKKPECILDYNQTKGGVDTVDHLIENYTYRRKSNRWTFNVFLYVIDVAAHNAYCLFKIKNNSKVANEKRQRRMQLESLTLSLIDDQIKKRADDLSRAHNGTQLTIIQSIRRIGYEVNLSKERPSTDPKKRMRCYLCEG